MVVASVAVAATDVAVDVAAPIVVASLPLNLAAAEGHLHLNHALGNDVVNILPWVDRISAPGGILPGPLPVRSCVPT